MSATITEPAPVLAGTMGSAEALARLARGRDGEAWSALLQHHGMAIWRMAQRITGDSSLCDDVCQETLLQIREHAAQFKSPTAQREADAAARGWIMCIAYRTALGMIRLRQRRSQKEHLAGLALNREAPAVHDSVLNAEELERIRGEIAGLPELLRSAVSLHFFGEMSYPELSSALDCSEIAARKRVERGLTRLRDRLVAGGVAISAGTLMIALSAPARACGASAATAATMALANGSVVSGASAASAAAPVSELFTIQRLAQWQALLHHPATPLLAGVAKTGGIVIMTKYVIGVAAVLMFGVTAVQHNRINAVSRDLSVIQERAGHVSELQQKLGALEQQLAETRGDALAFKASLSSRNEEITQLKSKIQKLEETPNAGAVTFTEVAPRLRALGAQGAVVNEQQATADTIKDARGLLDQLKSQVIQLNGQKFQFDTKDGKIAFSMTATTDGTGKLNDAKDMILWRTEAQAAGPQLPPKESAVKPPKPPKDPNENF